MAGQAAFPVHDHTQFNAMNLQQRLAAAPDDGAPVDMLAALFEARGWPCRSMSDEEIATEIQGSWTTYQLRCVWRAEDRVLQVLCLPEIRIPDDKRTVGAQLLALVNEQMWLGHFDMWSNGGVLLYRHAAMLGDDATLGVGQAQGLIETAVEECDRFYPAFQFILWGDKTAAQALDNALVDAAGEA